MLRFWVNCALFVIRLVMFAFDLVTLPIYFAMQKPWKREQQTKHVKARIVRKGRTFLTFRTIQQPRAVHIQMMQHNIDTLEKMFKYVAKLFGRKRCLGTRQILSEEDEPQQNGRIFKKYNLGAYYWKSFAEVERLATSFGRGLRDLGHEPYRRIVIFAETREEWMIAALGCFKQSIPIVTIYATLGDDDVIRCITETGVSTVITSHDLLPKLWALLPQCPKVHNVIYMEHQLLKTPTSNRIHNRRIQVLPFSKVIRNGSHFMCENVPPNPNDIAIIMYTSGSTGTPKGVLLTHKNCITSMKGICDMVNLYPDDVFIGFLPLAHVFELLAECVCLMTGISIGYSTPLTLVDTSSKLKKGCLGDASVLMPTCLTSMPVILDRISKAISDNVKRRSPFSRALFETLYNYKIKWTNRGFRTPIVDQLVFRKVAKLLGGRVRLILSGGAPLSAATHELIKTCLCVNLIQGYGLTETTSAATVMDDNDASYGRTGAPLTACDLRLLNWEEGNYRVSNKPNPQGEVIVGGNCVSLGYLWDASNENADFFEEDGCRWFKTGDIGEMHADGVLKIIDRKKDLIKLQAGEYVSLGKIETELKTSTMIDNICVYGDSSKQFTVALVVPNPFQFCRLAGILGVPKTKFKDLCASSVMKAAVLSEIVAQAARRKLQKFEVPAAVTLCAEVWSPQSGLVTATFKLKRKQIQERYQKDINRMYAC